MKALTICQPYAHLICLPDDDDRAKRVENRTWFTSHRGPLLIHAGKSRSWLASGDYGIPESEMTFGAIVGVCHLAGCVDATERGSVSYLNGLKRWPWLAGHAHAEPGMFWWVMTECRAFKEPIPYRGAQGLFDVPRDVVAEALQAIGGGA